MKALQNKFIGLVLPSVPGYSETFFNSKIAGLQQNGAEVVVFVANPEKLNPDLTYKVFYAPKLNGFKTFVALKSMAILLSATLFNFKKSIHFLALEKKDEHSFRKRLKSLIANHFILKHKVDWLHFGFGTMAIGRENVAAVVGAKMAVSFRGFDHYIYPLKNPNCYKKLFSRIVKYHVLSNGMQLQLERNGILSKDISIVTPAIDIDLFKNKSENNFITLNIITVARLHWIKGLEYTLEALSILKNEGIDFQYTIVGDGPERERLLFATHQLGLEKNVTFVGKLTPDVVKVKLSKASLYLQYSIQEGFCNAALEAQAMGLLCIVSDAEGLSENVLNNQTGWVVPKRNPELLAEKIKEVILLSEEKKLDISLNAINRVRSEFNIQKQTQEFVNFYEH